MSSTKWIFQLLRFLYVFFNKKINDLGFIWIFKHAEFKFLTVCDNTFLNSSSHIRFQDFIIKV